MLQKATRVIAKQVSAFAGLLRDQDTRPREIEDLRVLTVRQQAELVSLREKLAAPALIAQQSAYAKTCFAHWGEDMVLSHVFNDIPNGRYLDIGCFHPEAASNTQLLHRKGWSGVNVDPNKFMIDEFKLQRPNDVNLNVAVGKEHGTLEYYFFNDWASSNTCSPEFAAAISKGQNIPVDSQRLVEIVPLLEIMETYFRTAPPDFMNVDVEDLDADVIASNDWKRFRPKVIAVEEISFSSRDPGKSTIFNVLDENGYLFFSRTIFTNFFIERGFNASTHQFK